MGIKEFIQERGIVSLYHFTLIDNLDSILKYGLFLTAIRGTKIITIKSKNKIIKIFLNDFLIRQRPPF